MGTVSDSAVRGSSELVTIERTDLTFIHKKRYNMRLGAHNTMGTEMSGSDSENLEISPSLEKHPDAQSLVSSLNLTSELSLAQQKGQAEVDLYRIWYLLLNLNIFKIYC